MPLCDVTIVITTHNAENFIATTLSAALRQDYPHFEVVVVDDGSDDETARICESIVDPRLRFFRRPRIGRSRALNEAIRLANGKYIAINDADDLSLPYRLSQTISALRSQDNCALLGTKYRTVRHFCRDLVEAELDGIRAKTLHAPSVLSLYALYRRNPFVHSTVIFEKVFWEQAGGYDETLPLCIDYDFFFRLAQHGQIMLLPIQTVIHYENPSSHFKSLSALEYLFAIRSIRRRAQRALGLPNWIRVLELITYYEVVRSFLLNLQRMRPSQRGQPK